MKELSIGDLHNQVDLANEIIYKYGPNYDRIIFHGDYFDNYGDSRIEAQKTARWLKDNLDNEKLIFLLGNHDFHYMFSKCGSIRGTGYSRNKSDAINHILSRDDWKKFKFYYNSQGFVHSHAGFHIGLLNPMIGFDEEFINNRIDEELRIIKFSDDRGKAKWDPYHSSSDSLYYFGIGQERGGRLHCGGFLWQDWFMEFKAIDGVNQIVGHTKVDNIQIRNFNNSINANIDCFPREVLEIEEGKLKIIKINL